MLTDNELKVAKRKYKEHSAGCRDRIDRAGNPIEMRLTFEEWLDIWLSSGHWYERGCRKGQYVMSRIGDIGHYEIGNVEIKTVKENDLESKQSPEFQSKMKSVWESPEWRDNNKLAAQKRSQDHKWQENNRLKNQTLAQNPEWQKNQKLGSQLRSQNPEWQQNVKVAAQKKSHNPEWRENVKLANQKRSQDPKWREKNKLATQKAHNKAISCNGVIYASRIQAALALAPETRSTENSKICWLTTQMKKFPDRYFYITQSK